MSCPTPESVAETLSRIPLRVHMDLVPSSQMLVDPPEGGAVLILPAETRYEAKGGVTETSTERRVILSPEIPGPRIAGARQEWEVFGDLAARVRPELADRVRFAGTPEIREEIARVVPRYEEIAELKEGGDSFQYGGPLLPEGTDFPTVGWQGPLRSRSTFPTRFPPTAGSSSRRGEASSSTRWSRSAVTRSPGPFASRS